MLSSVMQRLNDRRDGAADLGEDAGFTLIELMVVLLILAILLAIAIPTFLGVTKSANDRAGQSNLNTAMVNAKAQFDRNGQSYSTPNAVTASVLQAAAVYTKTNNCWYQIDNPSGNTAAVAPFTQTAASISGSGSTTPMTGGAVTTVAAGNLLFSGTTAGTIYVEVKGDTTATDCNAQTPKIPATTSYQWLTTGFPST